MKKIDISITHDTIWNAVKFLSVLLFSYWAYYKLVPANVELVIGLGLPIGFFTFSGILIIAGLCVWLLWMITFELIPSLFLLILKSIDMVKGDGIKKFTVDIPIYDKDIVFLDNKFKRKKMNGVPESPWDFSDRIIKDILKKQMKRK